MKKKNQNSIKNKKEKKNVYKFIFKQKKKENHQSNLIRIISMQMNKILTKNKQAKKKLE